APQILAALPLRFLAASPLPHAFFAIHSAPRDSVPRQLGGDDDDDIAAVVALGLLRPNEMPSRCPLHRLLDPLPSPAAKMNSVNYSLTG
ncbi:unnamed protein product, partial [Urochloa humidicola]